MPCPAWRSSRLPRALQGWRVLGEAARAPTGQTLWCLPGGRAHTRQRPCVRRWQSPPRHPARGTQRAPLPSSCRVSPGSPRPLQSGGGRSRGWRLSLPSAPRGFGDGWRLQHCAPPGRGDPARAGGRRLGSGWRPRGMLSGKSPCRHPTRQGPAARTRGTRMDAGLALPGTTPLVAIALMEMAVSIVCRKKHSVGTRRSWAEGQGSGRESWGHARTWGSLGPR